MIKIKYKNLFFGFFLIIITIFNSINVLALEGFEADKGDLRCPLNSTSCKEYKDRNGKVFKVEIIAGKLEQDDDVQVIKTVEKIPGKSNLGQYKVYFNVKGKNVSQMKKVEDVYVTVIIDLSKTIKSKIGAMEQAVKTFSKKLIPDSENGISNYNLSLIEFAYNQTLKIPFQNSNFSNYKSTLYGVLGTKSHLEKGFVRAIQEFNKIENPDAKKYVLVFGDGRYWYHEDTDVSATKYGARILRDAGIKVFGIRYNGISVNSKLESRSARRVGGCDNLKTCQSLGYTKKAYGCCDTQTMRGLTYTANYPYYQASGNSDALEQYFEVVADEILNEVGSGSVSVSSNLTDNLGASFKILNENSTKKSFNVGRITESGYQTEPFIIKIDENSDQGWHDTNNGFNLKYVTVDGVEKNISSNENPEVYWYPPIENINACMGFSEIDNNKLVSNNYYSVNCNDTFYYNININNTVFSNKIEEMSMFNNAELGFPANIKLKSDVECIYVFNKNIYLKEYTEITNSISNSKDSKEIASLTVRKNELDKVLDTYINNINNIESYVDRFTNQEARMIVSYNNTNVLDNIEFINVSNVISNLNQLIKKEEIINGKKIIIDGSKTLTISKDMQLNNTCLDMKTGEQVGCNDNAKNQILGGNNFYAKIKYNAGRVSVNILNTGYSGKINIELKDCLFTSNPIDILYRQIDINDPFLSKFNTEKRIGKNFLNLDYKFDFTKMITDGLRTDKNTWVLDSDYKYTLSKNNINNIRKNTESVNDYLGSNCYFNNDNKYICDFTRNTLNNSSGELFTNVVLNK